MKRLAKHGNNRDHRCVPWTRHLGIDDAHPPLHMARVFIVSRGSAIGRLVSALPMPEEDSPLNTNIIGQEAPSLSDAFLTTQFAVTVSVAVTAFLALYSRRRLSMMMVTGPSFISDTAMSAPKTPRSTRCSRPMAAVSSPASISQYRS